MEVSNITKNTLSRMFSEGKRFDSRGLLDFREIEISGDVSNKSEGSARVKIGKTEVIAGVKLSVGEPYPDSPNKGNLMVSGDLLPLASPKFESGPPGFNAIELPRLVDRAVRESGIIDLSKLLIEKEKVWNLMIDIYPINDDGNIIDASLLAAVVALKNTYLPQIDKEGNIDYEKKKEKKLPLSPETVPISFSFFKLGDSIILDPTREEEEACDVRITLGISKWNGQHMINSCQKKGGEILTREDIEKITSILPEKFDELNKKLKKYI